MTKDNIKKDQPFSNKNFLERSLNYFKKIIKNDNNTMNADNQYENYNNMDEIIETNKKLSKSQQIQKDNISKIKEKELQLNSTSELLKTSVTRNEFKKKIIYTLIALIFLLFILSIATYIYFIRPKNFVN